MLPAQPAQPRRSPPAPNGRRPRAQRAAPQGQQPGAKPPCSREPAGPTARLLPARRPVEAPSGRRRDTRTRRPPGPPAPGFPPDPPQPSAPRRPPGPARCGLAPLSAGPRRRREEGGGTVPGGWLPARPYRALPSRLGARRRRRRRRRCPPPSALRREGASAGPARTAPPGPGTHNCCALPDRSSRLREAPGGRRDMAGRPQPRGRAQSRLRTTAAARGARRAVTSCTRAAARGLLPFRTLPGERGNGTRLRPAAARDIASGGGGTSGRKRLAASGWESFSRDRK